MAWHAIDDFHVWRLPGMNRSVRREPDGSRVMVMTVSTEDTLLSANWRLDEATRFALIEALTTEPEVTS